MISQYLFAECKCMVGKPKLYTCSCVGMWSCMINRATVKGKRQFLEVKDAGQTKINK